MCRTQVGAICSLCDQNLAGILFRPQNTQHDAECLSSIVALGLVGLVYVPCLGISTAASAPFLGLRQMGAWTTGQHAGAGRGRTEGTGWEEATYTQGGGIGRVMAVLLPRWLLPVTIGHWCYNELRPWANRDDVPGKVHSLTQRCQNRPSALQSLNLARRRRIVPRHEISIRSLIYQALLWLVP